MKPANNPARQAFEAEQGLLGSVMLDGGRSLHRVEQVRPEHFGTPKHAAIWSAIAMVVATGLQADAVTLLEYVSADVRGYVIELQQDAPGLANLEAYAELVIRGWRLREATQIAVQLRENLQAGDVSAIDWAMGALMDLAKAEQRAEWTMQEACGLAYEQLQHAVNNPGQLRGITTGLAELDRVLGGLHDSDLVLVGGRAAMGKTAFMLTMTASAAAVVPAGVISAEQPAVQIAQRLISQAAHIAATKLRTGDISEMEWPRLTAAITTLMQRNLFIYDRSAPSVDEVARIARKWQHKHGIRILFVDYLQRLQPSAKEQDEAKHERIATIAASLKNLARDLNIPVVALAQVKRDVEVRTDKRPRMGDLSDSSGLEKEADQILMLYRDEVYTQDSPDAGTAEILVEKNRHGPSGFVRCAWLAETMQFADLAPGYRPRESAPIQSAGRPFARHGRTNGARAA